jgi:DNA modification methylase
MSVYYSDDAVTLHHGHALDVLRGMPDGTVNCCVTSPPYFGLRDYGEPGQYGLEKSPAEYVANMRDLFAEVRRVLADDGTLFVNLGDSYATTVMHNDNAHNQNRAGTADPKARAMGDAMGHQRRYVDRPPKNLLGIPWRTAFALQDDGWILRNAIIWEKKNAMPESVRDRLSTKHETVFLFSKATWIGDNVAKFADVDAAWLAALVDGEGSITIARDKRSEKNPAHQDVFTITIHVANTCIPLLEKAGRLMGGALVHRNNEGVNRPGYAVRVSSEKAGAIIAAIQPWLIDKKDQARIALALQETQRRAGSGTAVYRSPEGRAYKERLWESMRAANRRDVQDLSWVKPLRRGRWVPNDYWFDLDPIREAPTDREVRPSDFTKADEPWGKGTGLAIHTGTRLPHEKGRNPGDVWTVPTQPFPGAHFAVFPVEIPRRCIASGCKPGGTVLDPFSGSGTTGLAAGQLGRKYVGIDLSAKYLDLSLNTRLAQTALLDGGAA